MVKAIHEGKVLISGDATRRPIFLDHNSWFLIEGVNACCSSETVVEISHSSNDTIRRVAAWDANDGNDKIFGVHYAQYNTLEDVAGWGTARKIFEFSYGGDFTTVRRAWARWERSTVTGPKMVYSLAYNNYHTLIENALGTWSGERMPESYTLQDYYGAPFAGPGAGVHRGTDVVQPYGVFAMDGIPTGRKADARLLGSLAYLTPTDSYPAIRLIFVSKMDGVRISDSAAYYPPQLFRNLFTFGLYALVDGTNPTDDVAENITGFGGAGPEIHHGWSVRNSLHGGSPDSVYSHGESVFNTSRGARLCYQYVDGRLTQKPLWPWPMNDRIVKAMIESGRKPVDVTATVEKMLGPIPPACRESDSGGVRPTIPHSKPTVGNTAGSPR